MLVTKWVGHKSGSENREQRGACCMLVREGGTRCAVLPCNPHHRKRATKPNLFCLVDDVLIRITGIIL